MAAINVARLNYGRRDVCAVLRPAEQFGERRQPEENAPTLGVVGVDGRNLRESHRGRTLAEVRDAAGHANVSITLGYLHVAVEDAAEVGKLFQ